MLKHTGVSVPSDFLEIIHVELPDEGWKLTVLEILGQNLVGEFIDVLDLERVAISKP